jgi:hypothetical protein
MVSKKNKLDLFR